MLRIERSGTNERGVGWHLPSKVGLGEWRPFVWWSHLAADQDNGLIGAFLSQSDRRSGTGQARADDHMRSGHQISICSESPAMRVRYTLTGDGAGGASTLPLRISNSAPWHRQVIVVPAKSPSASEHCSCVHV